jgi:hypothetical protein
VGEAAQMPAVTAGELESVHRGAQRNTPRERTRTSRARGKRERPAPCGVRRRASMVRSFQEGMRTCWVFNRFDHTIVAAQERKSGSSSSHRTLRGPNGRRPLALGCASAATPSPVADVTICVCERRHVPQRSEFGRVHSSPIWMNMVVDSPPKTRLQGAPRAGVVRWATHLSSSP